MLKVLFSGLIVLAILTGCKRPVENQSQTAFTVGSWWAQADSNLLVAVSRNQSIRLCLDSEGLVEEARLIRETDHFRTMVRLALLEWFRAIQIRVQIKDELGPCHGDVASGKLRVVLHYKEESFQKEISQTKSPTLGVYLIGSGSLFLNIAGVTNPHRDSTGGYKTLLHELGHAFGLHHTNVPGSIMLPNLSGASDHLTADDIRGIETVWKKIQLLSKPNTTQRASPVQNSKLERGIEQSIKNESSSVLFLRYDSFFKDSTQQSTAITDQKKCHLQQGQKLQVKVLDAGQTTEKHLRVQLEESISNCVFGNKGQIGFLYEPHVD